MRLTATYQRGQPLVVCRDESDGDLALGTLSVDPRHRPPLFVESVYMSDVVTFGNDSDLRLSSRESLVEIDPRQRAQGHSDGVAGETF